MQLEAPRVGQSCEQDHENEVVKLLIHPPGRRPSRSLADRREEMNRQTAQDRAARDHTGRRDATMMTRPAMTAIIPAIVGMGMLRSSSLLSSSGPISTTVRSSVTVTYSMTSPAMPKMTRSTPTHNKLRMALPFHPSRPNETSGPARGSR